MLMLASEATIASTLAKDDILGYFKHEKKGQIKLLEFSQ